MDRFDPSTCQLVFLERGSILVNEESVGEVMGVPKRFLEVQYGKDNDAIKFMREQFGSTRKKQPSMKYMEDKLAAMRPANYKFLHFFITFAMCAILAPTIGIRVSPRVYPSLVKIKDAKNLNMCKFVIMMLCKVLYLVEIRNK
jgi:hypothetical protein